MSKYNYFSHKQYDNKVYVLTEHYAPGSSYSFGAVWSRERCAVIDPGLGLFADIRKYTETLLGYEKAIYAICTSGRAQAVGAVKAFDEAFVDEPDLELAKANQQIEKRLAALKELGAADEVLSSVKAVEKEDTGSFEIFGVHDPRVLRSPSSVDHFHLGGVHLEGVRVPGVTPGSMIITVHGDDTINCAFCGKTIVPGTNDLTKLDKAGFKLYHDSLIAAIDNMEQGCQKPKPDMSMHLFCADSAEEFGLDVPRNLVKASEEILEGKTEKDLPAGGTKKLHVLDNIAIAYDSALLAE